MELRRSCAHYPDSLATPARRVEVKMCAASHGALGVGVLAGAPRPARTALRIGPARADDYARGCAHSGAEGRRTRVRVLTDRRCVWNAVPECPAGRAGRHYTCLIRSCPVLGYPASVARVIIETNLIGSGRCASLTNCTLETRTVGSRHMCVKFSRRVFYSVGERKNHSAQT